MKSREIMRLLEDRRTYRRFDESRKIGDEVIFDMQKAAQLASSAMNRQPLRYIYVRTTEIVNAIFDITSWGAALPNNTGMPKTGERPTLFVCILSVKDAQSRYTAFDEGLAASNLTLAAASHGVGSCILGSVNAEKLKALLNITDEFDVSCVIGFGYPAHKSQIIEIDEGGSTKYYLDDDGNYIVPKRKISDTVKIV